jgi:hypothetical protein
VSWSCFASFETEFCFKNRAQLKSRRAGGWNYESYKPNHLWNNDWDNRAHLRKIVSVDENGNQEPIPRPLRLRLQI